MSYNTEFLYPYEKDLLNINAIRFKILNDKIFNALEYLTVKYKRHIKPLAKSSMYFRLDLVDNVISGCLPHPFRICMCDQKYAYEKYYDYEKENWNNAFYLIRTTPLFFTGKYALESHNFRNKLYQLIYGEDIDMNYETIGDNDFLSVSHPDIANLDEITRNIKHTSYKYCQSFDLLAYRQFDTYRTHLEIQPTGFNRTICHDPASNSNESDHELYYYKEPLPLDAYKDVKDVVMKSVLSMFYHLLYDILLPVEKWKPYTPKPHPDVVNKYSDKGYKWEDYTFNYYD